MTTMADTIDNGAHRTTHPTTHTRASPSGTAHTLIRLDGEFGVRAATQHLAGVLELHSLGGRAVVFVDEPDGGVPRSNHTSIAAPRRSKTVTHRLQCHSVDDNPFWIRTIVDDMVGQLKGVKGLQPRNTSRWDTCPPPSPIE